METILQNKAYLALVQNFGKRLSVKGYSIAAVYNYPRYVAYLLQYAEERGIYHIKDLKQQTVREYLAYLERRPNKRRPHETLSTQSIVSCNTAIDNFLAYLHEIGMEQAPLPTRNRIPIVPKKIIQILTPEEVQELYHVAQQMEKRYGQLEENAYKRKRLQVALDLCYGCGMRKSEALNVELKDINFNERTIHIRQGKNYKDRYVPMSKKVYESIQSFVYEYRHTETNQTRRNKLYPYDAIHDALTAILDNCDNEALKAKKPSLHTLRHSIASHLLNNGMEIENISKFLGHSSISTTQKYTHLLDEEL